RSVVLTDWLSRMAALGWAGGRPPVAAVRAVPRAPAPTSHSGARHESSRTPWATGRTRAAASAIGSHCAARGNAVNNPAQVHAARASTGLGRQQRDEDGPLPLAQVHGRVGEWGGRSGHGTPPRGGRLPCTLPHAPTHRLRHLSTRAGGLSPVL